jgi:hypothetical protein
MEDSTSRTAGLVLEAVTRFLTTSRSTKRMVNTLTWSVLISEQFSDDAELMLDCGQRKNEGFIKSYLKT